MGITAKNIAQYRIILHLHFDYFQNFLNWKLWSVKAYNFEGIENKAIDLSNKTSENGLSAEI